MSHSIEVARHHDTVYARVVGLGSFNNAGPFREFVDAMVQRGVRKIIVDMAQCNGVDSTFCGTLMGFRFCPVDSTGDGKLDSECQISVTIVNQNPATRRAMNSLGLHAILDIRDEPVQVPPLKLDILRDGWNDEARRLRLIVQAHENLVRLDQSNRERFGPFIDQLMKESSSRSGNGGA